MQDAITIKNLHVPCQVGDTPEEQAFPQILTLSADIFLSLAPAGQSDNMKETVDYAVLINKIQHTLKQRKFVLIEAVAETVAQLVLENKRVEKTRITVGKKVFPDVESVGVTLVRSRS